MKQDGCMKLIPDSKSIMTSCFENRILIAASSTQGAFEPCVAARTFHGSQVWPSGRSRSLMESLILAQDERWRRASYMQVEGEAHLRVRGDRRTGE